MKKKGVVDDLDIVSFDEMKKLPYYQDFLAPEGLQWFCRSESRVWGRVVVPFNSKVVNPIPFFAGREA